jgi:hypothetical protein
MCFVVTTFLVGGGGVGGVRGHLPWLGVLVYLIVNHDGMAERRMKEARAAQAQFDDDVRTTAESGGAAGEIEKAEQLLDSGAIGQAEFDAIKAKALA